MASVIGRDFPVSILEAVPGMKEDLKFHLLNLLPRRPPRAYGSRSRDSTSRVTLTCPPEPAAPVSHWMRTARSSNSWKSPAPRDGSVPASSPRGMQIFSSP
jgi:hypothetical protein